LASSGVISKLHFSFETVTIRKVLTLCRILASHRLKMSRNSEILNLSERYAILLDQSLKENQALSEELKEREVQNCSKIKQLTSKVDTLEQARGNGNKTCKKSSRSTYLQGVR